MKKIFLVLNGGYEDVTSYEKLPKWDWQANPVFEGWLLNSEHGIITRDSPDGASVYTVVHQFTKERHHIWGGVVLNDRFNKVNNLTKMRVTYLGVKQGKKYKDFKVEVDKDAVFNHADFPNIEVRETPKTPKSSGYQEVRQEQAPVTNTERYVSEDDIPF